MKTLTIDSLFDGIAGFPYAAKKCGIETLEAIGSFIKYTDKNGNKIFTNDILFYEEESIFYVVKQDEDTDIGLACTQKGKTIKELKQILNSDFCRKCEIVGNIYDNYLPAESKTEE